MTEMNKGREPETRSSNQVGTGKIFIFSGFRILINDT